MGHPTCVPPSAGLQHWRQCGMYLLLSEYLPLLRTFSSVIMEIGIHSFLLSDLSSQVLISLPLTSPLPTRTQPEDPNAGKTPEQIAAEAAQKRKAEELRHAKAAKDAERAALRRAAEEEAALMAKETPEERAIRERMAVERSDHAMADELFGGPGLAGGQQPGSRPASSLSLSSTTSSPALGGSKVYQGERGDGFGGLCSLG